MLCAYLVCLEPGYTPDASRFSNITENTDKFFRKPINDSLEVWSSEGADGWEVRLIRFFKSSECRVVACALKQDAIAADYLKQPKNLERNKIDTVEANSSSGEIGAVDKVIGTVLGRMAKFDYSVRSRVVWLKGDLEEQVWQASHFLRSSATLTAHLFEDLNHTSFVADAKGVAVVDRSFDSEIRAKNLVMVSALACAYQAVLNDAIETLAIAGSAGEGKAIPEIRKWSKFLAAYYFKEPVRTTTVEIIHLYNKIRIRQRIAEQYEEVTDQLRLLSDLAQIERSEQMAVAAESRAKKLTEETECRAAQLAAATEARAAQLTKEIASKANFLARRAFWVGGIALLVAIFSILQVTPKAVGDFGAGWSKCFTKGWSDFACFAPTHDQLGVATQTQAPVKTPPKKKLKNSTTE